MVTKKRLIKLSEMVGKEAYLETHQGNLAFKIKVLDVKASYGKARYKVTPMAGKGSIWVENVFLEKQLN